jgi:hypothetical protein
MFLNSHQRILVPSVLGVAVTFAQVGPTGLNGSADPGLKVPTMIAFDNDSDYDVVLHFDASDDGTNFVDDSGATTSPQTVKSGGFISVPMANPGAKAVQIRASAATACVIDSTPMYRYSGVQQ